jgi:kinesin family protein 18/19
MSTEFAYEVRASYVEIYNENIKDLLIANNRRVYLDLRDDPTKGLVIAGVTQKEVKNIKDLMRLLVSGNSRRTTESTKANSESSRSHAVLQVMVTKKPLTANYKY